MQFQPIQQLLSKRMDRKQFLQAVGLLVLTVIGLGFLLKQHPQQPRSAGKQFAPAHNDTYGS